MTSRYYKEKGWDAASERTVVNLKEFNNGLLAHGSESKPQVSITGYHIAHIKTPVKDSTHCRDIEPATQIQRNSRIYKGSRKHTHTHKCVPDVRHCLGWLVDMRSGYTTSVWMSCRGLRDWGETGALQPQLFIHGGGGGGEDLCVSCWKPHMCVWSCGTERAKHVSHTCLISTEWAHVNESVGPVKSFQIHTW